MGLPIYTKGALNSMGAFDLLLDQGPNLRSRSDEAIMTSLEVMPNPSRGPFYLEWTDQMEQNIPVRVFDAQGRTIFSGWVPSQRGTNRWECPFPVNQSGLFFLTLELAEETIRRKIIRF